MISTLLAFDWPECPIDSMGQLALTCLIGRTSRFLVALPISTAGDGDRTPATASKTA